MIYRIVFSTPNSTPKNRIYVHDFMIEQTDAVKENDMAEKIKREIITLADKYELQVQDIIIRTAYIVERRPNEEDRLVPVNLKMFQVT